MVFIRFLIVFITAIANAACYSFGFGEVLIGCTIGLGFGAYEWTH